MKICSKCKRELDVSMFSKHKRRKDGLQGHCKECNKAIKATWYEANAEHVKARTKAWHEANPDRMKALNKAWHEANPDRIKAHYKAWYAARRAEFLAANPGHIPKSGYKPDKPGFFYCLHITSRQGDFVGYGITNNPTRRLKEHTKTLLDIGAPIEETFVVEFADGYDAVRLEQSFDKMSDSMEHLDAPGFKTESYPGDVKAFKKAVRTIKKFYQESANTCLRETETQA